VAMIHKQTHTFVIDLHKDSYFGELGFFNGEPRTLSAKSRDFTEVYRINKDDFFEICENYIEAITAIRTIKEALEQEDYKPLKMHCYLCKEANHISLKCPKYSKWKGNLMRIYANQMNNKTSKKNSNMMSSGNENSNKNSQEHTDSDYSEPLRPTFFVYNEEAQENLLHVSMESEDDRIIKESLIKQYTGMDDIKLDGPLLQKILENPVEA
jgi:hypothetical protein